MRRFVIFAISLLVITLAVTAVIPDRASVTSRSLLEFFDNRGTSEISREDLLAERYYTMVDEDGQEIVVTGRIINVGDEYITAENKLYRVFRVEDRTAHARFIREVGAVFEDNSPGIFVMLQERLGGWGIISVQTEEDEDVEDEENVETDEEAEDEEETEEEAEEQPSRLIGIYHTHNAESYVPTDGTDSIYGEGGIHNVGMSFTETMGDKNVRVIHDETLHLPHDRSAYRRSRVTAEKLLEQNPDVIFDVHRDAAPMEAYATEIEDEWVTQIQIVVGRQNANMNVTRQFALDMKNAADQIRPGLVKGIFMAQGNYNQDLTPMSLLLEVGAHQNTREAAEDGIAIFADVVSYYFYGDPDDATGGADEGAVPGPAGQAPGGGQPPGPTGPPGTPGGQNVERAAIENIFMLLSLTAAIIVVFLILNAGSMEDIHLKIAPYLKQIQPYVEPGDRILEPLQEKIHAAAVKAKVPEAMASLGILVGNITRNGDRFLAYWQERIRDAALTLKERVIILYDELTNRKRLR